MIEVPSSMHALYIICTPLSKRVCYVRRVREAEEEMVRMDGRYIGFGQKQTSVVNFEQHFTINT